MFATREEDVGSITRNFQLKVSIDFVLIKYIFTQNLKPERKLATIQEFLHLLQSSKFPISQIWFVRYY